MKHSLNPAFCALTLAGIVLGSAAYAQDVVHGSAETTERAHEILHGTTQTHLQMHDAAIGEHEARTMAGMKM